MKSSQGIDIEKFSTLSVLDAQGNAHSIATFWHEQRAAIVFVRHFG